MCSFKAAIHLSDFEVSRVRCIFIALLCLFVCFVQFSYLVKSVTMKKYHDITGDKNSVLLLENIV